MISQVIFSAMFIAVGIGIILKQRRAKSCPVHNRTAGLAAMVIAFLAIALGISIFVFAIWSH